MPTMTDCPPDQFTIQPDPSPCDPRALVASPTGGFFRVLAQGAVEQARVDGPVTALRDLVRTETFLRSFRSHLLRVPREARGDSYNVGLIMIELMIMREALRSPGRPLAF